MGSLTIASHLRKEAARRSSLTLRSSGRITVGPVTTVMAPNSTAGRQSMPPASAAASEASTKEIGRATAVSRHTPSPAERSSRKSSARPPSNTTMATASPTIGCRPGPNANAGRRICSPGPMIRPVAKSSTMAGSFSRHATHCAPTPATAMERTAVATVGSMAGLCPVRRARERGTGLRRRGATPPPGMRVRATRSSRPAG